MTEDYMLYDSGDAIAMPSPLMTHLNPIKILSLNDLRDNKPERPGWSLTFGGICADASAVCLDDGGHSIPVKLTIERIQPCEIQIQWDAIDDVAESRYENR